MNHENLYDVVIVGGGVAGLTAALYLTRARYRVIVIEKEKFGGQITITNEIVNYPGIFKTSGRALTDEMQKQAASFGTEFLLAEVTNLELDKEIKKIYTDKGVYTCLGVLIATGAHPRNIGFPGEKEFQGRGVAYCATCDGEFFTDKEVFVVGGGFAAAEESVFLTKYAKHVTILVREPDFTCAETVAQKAKDHSKITILYHTEVVKLEGDTVLRTIQYRNNQTDEKTEFSLDNDTFGVFIFAGYVPDTQLIKGKVTLDHEGYIITDYNKKTNLEGVYAAGDVCQKNLRQVVTATGDAAIAATELEKYVAIMQEKTGLYPDKPLSNPFKETNQVVEKQTFENQLLSKEIKNQLATLFSRMMRPLKLRLYLDERPISFELKEYMQELTEQTDLLTLEISHKETNNRPYVQVLYEDDTETGICFHGVPGGHEFTAFVLGLYNVSGPGQSLDDAIKTKIKEIKKPIDMEIVVSLSCTMCPDLVIATQKIASLNPLISVHVYDINHFEYLKEQYHIMSVPCLIINQNKVLFGKKDIQQILKEIE